MNRLIKLLTTFAVGAVFLLGAVAVWAAITGSISGLVTDPAGAPVVNTTVTATNQLTGVQSKIATDSKGFYSFPALAVGIYTVQLSSPGYKEFLEKDVTINANSAVRVDVRFALGKLTETTTVTADALRVETQSTQLGDVIEGAKMTAVPLNGRAFTDLLALQPGVSPYQNVEATYVNRPVSGNLNSGNQSINGGRETANGFMVNGAIANEGVANGTALMPNLDSIQEFRILTSNFDAEYGNFSGGQINVVTKSGTNRYHGDLFDFIRNTALDARNYYSPTRGAFVQNQFGGTIGGPIKKDRMFFFGDYQGTLNTIGATVNYPVPSVADRGGNLSDQTAALLASDPANGGTGVAGPYWANILSQRLGYAVNSGEPYYTQGCTSTTQCVFPNAIIPATAFSPVAKNLLQYIPLPNQPSNYFSTSSYPEHLNDEKGSLRADINTRFGQVFAYYFQDWYTQTNPFAAGDANVPGFTANTMGRAQMANIGLTTTHGSSSVNEARLSYLRNIWDNDEPSGGLGPSLESQGFVTPWGPAGGVGLNNPAFQGVMPIFFNNYTIGIPQDTMRNLDNTFQGLDHFTRIVGTHTLQFGVEFHYDQIAERNYDVPNGSFNFNGSETGYDFADFLIGAPANFQQASIQIMDSRTTYFGTYAQDSWRATPTVTLNYGLRYEIMPPFYDTGNKLETIVPGLQSVVFPGAPTGYVFPGDPGIPRTLAPTDYKNFAPRIGMAYSPGAQTGLWSKITGGPGKTSIRAGYGIFYTAIEDLSNFEEVGDAPYGQFYSSPAPPLFDTPYVDRGTGFVESNAFPFVFPPKNTSPSHPDTSFNWANVEPISYSLAYYYKNVVPYTEEWELTVQRQVGENMVVSAAYVANQGHHLLVSEEANPGNSALCLQLSNPAALAPGQQPCGPFLENNVFVLADGQTVNGTRGPLGNNFGPNPYMITKGNSSYNSLQVSIQQTAAHWNYLLGYTFAKCMDDGSALTGGVNFSNPALSRGLCHADVQQDLVVSGTVHLPSTSASGAKWANAITRGWAISDITTFASGLPVTFSETDDRSLAGAGENIDLPNYNQQGGPLLGGGSSQNPRTGKPYFNTSLFTPENLGTFGTSRRRFFHGPGINNTDMALLRNIGLPKTTQLQFRLEAFNVFNHAQFQTPGGNINDPGTFGIVTAANAPRIMQVALKYVF